MKRSGARIMGRCVLVMVLFFSMSAPAYTADRARKTNSGFWSAMSVRLQRVVPETKASASDGGAGNSSADRSPVLYWKGGKPDIVVPDAELAAFNLALQAVVDGKRDEAVKGFEQFLSQYPDSLLAEDAKAAVSELQDDKAK